MELDSLEVINILSQQDVDSHACDNIIREVQSFLSRAWNISMHHIQRDANVVADQLAKVAIGWYARIFAFVSTTRVPSSCVGAGLQRGFT